MKKRIMIITDSMAMPFPEVHYAETWIYLLKNEFPQCDIIDRPAKGSMSTRLAHEGGGGLDLLELYSPDLAIIQLGITECAPRLFKKKGLEYSIMNRMMPGQFKNRYIRYVKKNRIRSPHITIGSPRGFRMNFINYLERAEKIGTAVIAILIAPPSMLFLKKSPHISTNIHRYNDILRGLASIKKNFQVLEPFNENTVIDEVSIDELHINGLGHKIIFQRLKELINNTFYTKI